MHLPKAVISAVAAFLLLRPPIRLRWGTLAGASAIGLLIMFFPNMLIALTDKYQRLVPRLDTGIMPIQLYRISALRCLPLRVSLPSCRHLRVIDWRRMR